ncbi:hypothetical protein FS749_012896 [Ceratobasidium sp. UAMH 11750]|nr:hypothetical protein FS749_012896 [Ceratobasidium sp. UAMH 11750]
MMLRATEDAMLQDEDFEDAIIIATCPECRCPYTPEKICGFRTEYLAARSDPAPEQRPISPPPERASSSKVAGRARHSNAGETSDDRSARAESSGEADFHSEASTRAAIKMDLEEQVSEIFAEGPESVDPDYIMALNGQIQDWLAAEKAEGRVKEHILLRSSVDLLMRSF